MISKPRKTKRYKRIRRRVIAFVILLVVLALFFEKRAVPFAAKCARIRCLSIASGIISDSFYEIINNADWKYEDFSHIIYSESGELKGISENSVNVNRFKALVEKSIQKKLNKGKMYYFSLPLGAFTGLTLLSNTGPPVEINFRIEGSVSCRVKSKFIEAGVNQTLHRIYLIVHCKVFTVSTDFREEYSFNTDYEIAQTAIVGRVPSTFADIVR